MTPTEFETWLKDPDRRPLVMGVLNVTPDSFSDGGRYADPAAAVTHGRDVLDAGADLLDVGGESTRPGSARTPADEQIRRVVPVIEALRRDMGDGCLLSIDTTQCRRRPRGPRRGRGDHQRHLRARDRRSGNAPPRRRTGLSDRPDAHAGPARHDAGQPDLSERRRGGGRLPERARPPPPAPPASPPTASCSTPASASERPSTTTWNSSAASPSSRLGRPLVLGTSRKGFLGRIAGEPEPRDRLFATAASVAWCVANRAAIVRVHDVGAMARVVRMIRAIQVGWTG